MAGVEHRLPDEQTVEERRHADRRCRRTGRRRRADRTGRSVRRTDAWRRRTGRRAVPSSRRSWPCARCSDDADRSSGEHVVTLGVDSGRRASVQAVVSASAPPRIRTSISVQDDVAGVRVLPAGCRVDGLQDAGRQDRPGERAVRVERRAAPGLVLVRGHQGRDLAAVVEVGVAGRVRRSIRGVTTPEPGTSSPSTVETGRRARAVLLDQAQGQRRDQRLAETRQEKLVVRDRRPDRRPRRTVRSGDGPVADQDRLGTGASGRRPRRGPVETGGTCRRHALG